MNNPKAKTPSPPHRKGAKDNPSLKKKGEIKVDQDATHADQWLWNRLDAFLLRHQLKQTKQRRLIIEYFLTMDKHVDADDLHGIVRRAGHNIGLATIYRTLALLKEAGLVDQRNFSDGRSVYELARPDTHHDHLVCTQCGLVCEFEDDRIEAMQEEIATKYGFALTAHRHDLFGLCAACQNPKPT